MKRLVSLILTISLICTMFFASPFSLGAKAAISGTTGACTWILDGTVLTISGNGEMGNYYLQRDFPWGNSITKVIITEGVTSVGEYAFSFCRSLTSVEIPDTVTSIGEYAFEYCGLTSIEIPSSVTSIAKSAFVDCKDLEEVYVHDLSKWCQIDFANACSNPMYTASRLYLNGQLITELIIPEGVTNVGSYAFLGCKSLTSVEIPSSVTNIGDSAFCDCDSLKSVEIPDSVTSIGNAAFASCSSMINIEMPDSITSIGSYAFSGCSGLTSVSVPNGVTSIGEYVFNDCTSLTSIEIPSSVTSIAGDAFDNCTALEEVYIYDLSKWCQIDFANVCSNPMYMASQLYLNDILITELIIPDGVTHIGQYVFRNCKSLTSVEIPSSVTNIGADAFYDCDSLKSVEIPSSVTCMGEYAFYGCRSLTSIKIPNAVTSIESCTFYGCHSLTSVKIPDSVTNIGAGAFAYCGNLTSVNIPSGVTNIGDGAFASCFSLTSVEIPSSVTNIGAGAFAYCGNLTSVNIPSSVNSIENYAFSHCGSLTSFSIPNGVTSIGTQAFAFCSGLVSIEIPASVTNIANHAFDNCTALKKVYIHDLAKWCQITFDTSTYLPSSLPTSVPLYYASELYLNGELITELIIPDGVTHIGQYVFRNCKSLTSVEIPSSVTNIGTGAFYDCDSLKSVEIPSSVTCMGEYAFYGCDSLTKVRILDGITHIAADTFASCSSLTNVEIPSSVTRIGEYAFLDCYSLTDIWYHGSKEDKSNIHVGYYINNNISPTWHYHTCSFNEHVYRHDCDSTCENCDWVRVTANIVGDEHIFSVNKRVTCQYCGYSKQPYKPVIESKSTNTIILVANEIYEYSIDGENWQLSNIFSGLVAGNTYTFYQRVKAQADVLASKKSEGLTLKFKNNQSKPFQPEVLSCTTSSISLIPITNGEYSLDGINWQNSNVFENLQHATDYTFYQRKAETDTHYASESSDCLVVRTEEIPECILNPLLHQYDNTCDTDCNVCGFARTIQHTYSNACDTTCNVCTETRSITHNYKTTTTKATLAKNGSVVKKCTVCGKVASKSTIYYPKSFALSTTAYTYTGGKKTPSITVKDAEGKKLVNGTDYKLTYSSSSRKSIGRYSVKITFMGQYSGSKTLYYTIGPKNPTSVKATLYGHDDVKVTWSKVSGASGYRVYYKKATSSTWSSKTTTGTSMKLANLADGVKYDIKVVAYKTIVGYKCYNGGKSTSIYTLKKITGVTVKKSGTKVKASWTNISGETGYQISQSTKKSGTKIVVTYKTASGKYKIVSATKGKTYYYKVRAYKVVSGKKIYGPWSTVVKYVRK